MCSDIRDTLWRDVKLELGKSAGLIDPEHIDRRINELCELQARRSNLRPPEATEAKVNAVITRITARVHQKTPARRFHPFIRLAAAACIVLVFTVSVFFASNYVYARITDRCFLNKTNITLCCGTGYCPCKVKENTDRL